MIIIGLIIISFLLFFLLSVTCLVFPLVTVAQRSYFCVLFCQILSGSEVSSRQTHLLFFGSSGFGA
jgi:hypothetical protein